MYRVLLLVFSYFAYGCTTASLPMMGADTAPGLPSTGRSSWCVIPTNGPKLCAPVPSSRRREGPILAHAKQAMEQASGCKVRGGTLYGDAVLAEAMLSCPGAAPAQLVPVWNFRPAP